VATVEYDNTAVFQSFTLAATSKKLLNDYVNFKYDAQADLWDTNYMRKPDRIAYEGNKITLSRFQKDRGASSLSKFN